ncbi:MAG TPA: nitroreductase family protein [Phototrophicaceae bacterium]|nr:nitroreductase family protein [Phototrophicaceae bacterium]
MDVYEALARRQTIRDFADKEIPADVIRKLLEAGLKAPSNDHLRRWEFIVIQDRALREEISYEINAPKTRKGAETIINKWGLTDPAQREMYLDGIPKQQAMILNAGALILPCFYTCPVLKPESLSSLNYFASIWCCVENILVAAAAEGIFGVTRIPFETERKHLKERLHIPEDYEIPCYLALGYPKETAKRPQQSAINLDDKIHLNAW